MKSLFALLQKPALWQRSSAPFWDDEHISKSMLACHLDPNSDAASRKQETIDASVGWLSTMIPAGGRVLDLGCGPGLYTKRLSEMGYLVTGMDFSRSSIEYAKSQDQKTCYLLNNYLDFTFADTFDAVTLIYGDYAALTPAERKILLGNVYRALKPGGLFIFDVFTDVQFKRCKADRTCWKLEENGGFWSAKPHILLEASYLYEHGTVSVDQCVVITDDEMTEYLIWDTAFTMQRLADEVLPAGYQLKSAYDDICGKPYTGEAETLCFVLEKPGR